MGGSRKKSGRRAGSFRICAGCRKRQPRLDSLRLVKDESGAILPDLYGKLPGRGVHLCPDLACIMAAKDQKAYNRGYKSAVIDPDCNFIAKCFIKFSLSQIRAMLSTAASAGWIFKGRTAVENAIKKGKVALVIVAKNASASLIYDTEKLCQTHGTQHSVILTKDDLYSLFSGKPLSVVAIGHRGLAKRMSRDINIFKKLDSSLSTMTSARQSGGGSSFNARF